jgi:hypothetical protein
MKPFKEVKRKEIGIDVLELLGDEITKSIVRKG